MALSDRPSVGTMASYNTLQLATRLITMVVSVNPIMVLIVVASSTPPSVCTARYLPARSGRDVKSRRILRDVWAISSQ